MDDPENVFGPAKESPYDAYIEGPGDDEDENEPDAAAPSADAAPSSPEAEESDVDDADDENDSPVKAKKRGDPKGRVPDNDDFDDFYSDEERTRNPTLAEFQAQSPDNTDDEDEAEEEEAEEDTVRATTSQPTSAVIIWRDDDEKAAQESGETVSGPKPAPLGPKKMPSSMLRRYVRTRVGQSRY